MRVILHDGGVRWDFLALVKKAENPDMYEILFQDTDVLSSEYIYVTGYSMKLGIKLKLTKKTKYMKVYRNRKRRMESAVNSSISEC